jgi:hypothetical protein
MEKIVAIIGLSLSTMIVGCKKEGCTDPNAINYDEKAKKENNTCSYPEPSGYNIPTTYVFTNVSGTSTVDYSGQTDRLSQLSAIMTYIKTGVTTTIDNQQLLDMFANNAYFSGTTKNLKDKCFALDVDLMESLLDSNATVSLSNGVTASNGVAGKLTTGTSEYLFNADGREPAQLFEKMIMGAVCIDQALNGYFSDTKMNVDNTTPVEGKTYTAMEHHWDEAFGYFGVDATFPSVLPSEFWGKYCNKQDALLNSNAVMMDNFLKGRAAISNNEIADRDASILAIRNMWEAISANQAIAYIETSISYFGTDQAKYLHNLSEAFAFAWNLRYAPETTRKMTPTEHAALIAMFGDNFWNLSLVDLNNIKATLEAEY